MYVRNLGYTLPYKYGAQLIKLSDISEKFTYDINSSGQVHF